MSPWKERKPSPARVPRAILICNHIVHQSTSEKEMNCGLHKSSRSCQIHNESVFACYSPPHFDNYKCKFESTQTQDPRYGADIFSDNMGNLTSCRLTSTELWLRMSSNNCKLIKESNSQMLDDNGYTWNPTVESIYYTYWNFEMLRGTCELTQSLSKVQNIRLSTCSVDDSQGH